MTRTYDAIVIGIGGMGSAALYHLASRGQRVLGLEQFALDNELAASASPTRGFRKAYFSHASYVALANHAQGAWRALETASQQSLLQLNGALFIGPAQHPGVLGVTRSAQQHGLPHELLTSAELERRYPVLKVHGDDVGVLERDAGVLFADRCNAAHRSCAQRAGAELRAQEAVLAIESGELMVVRTNRAEYLARQLIVTAGPWLGSFFSGVLRRAAPLPLRLERQVELWFAPTRSAGFGAEQLPLFHFGLRDGSSYYGVPAFDAHGVKVVRHYGGRTLDNPLERVVSSEDEADVRRFLRTHVPAADGVLTRAKVCLNTNTPDMHFVLGRHPQESRVLVAGGCSGHAFKLVPVIGEILADLAIAGTTKHPISVFAPTRFGT